MSIRTKTILMSVLTLLGLLIVLDAGMWIFVSRTFGKLEQREARESAKHGVAIINATLSEISKKSCDWAAWDDTYNFVKDKNQAYIDSNLGLESMASLGTNFMLFFDNRGQLVYSACADTQTKQAIPLPDDLLSKIKASSALLTNTSVDDVHQGILITKSGPLMLAKRPITQSSGEEPINGTLIMARYLDKAMLAKLSSDYSLSLGVARIETISSTSDYAQAQQELLSGKARQVVITDSSEKIAAFSMINGIDGKPALLLRVESPRDIYAQSLIMIRYTTVGIVLVGLIFGLLNATWLDFTVLRRLTRLDAYTKQIMLELGLIKT